MAAERPAGAALPATEQANPATARLDQMSALELARAMNAEDARVAPAVARELEPIARAIEAVTARLRSGGRLIYLGAGTSGRLGVLDASECPSTFSTPPDLVIGCLAGGADALAVAADEVEDRAESGAADVARLGVTGRDALVGISASGRTPYVLGGLGAARQRGALTIGLACNAGGPLAALCDVVIAPCVGPEVVAGSTRLKAGTAQKMVLNMLSTGVMVALGKTYGNLMVDVRPTNAKLRLRALRIVTEATGLDEPAAARLLRACGDETRTAILCALAGIAPDAARARLTAHGGVIRAALEAAP
ncbi:MAG TPA: N-acetylmuramic acid 6-phosphate etherase [Ktedonobacterales bacterium]|nr:N-acetylmuramic acid 6-phosphate etherase [Ktedonobacterales bacterium]